MILLFSMDRELSVSIFGRRTVIQKCALAMKSQSGFEVTDMKMLNQILKKWKSMKTVDLQMQLNDCK